MSELTRITAREANQRFSEILAAVEAKGQGFIVTKRGVPVARIVPIEEGQGRVTPEQQAALDRLLASARPLGIGKSVREDAYEGRLPGPGMAGEPFGLDTNVLLYFIDSADPTRHGPAVELVRLAAASGRCVLSIQNIGEFYVVATRKGHLTRDEAAAQARDWGRLFRLVEPNAADALLALATEAAGRFAYWDALLLATLARAGCTLLLTEDMQDGARLDGITVRNPFAGKALPDELRATLG